MFYMGRSRPLLLSGQDTSGQCQTIPVSILLSLAYSRLKDFVEALRIIRKVYRGATPQENTNIRLNPIRGAFPPSLRL